MAEKTAISRPLKDESEEEKRRREAAQNYLDGRAAFTASQKPGYSVDMTDLDTSGMSNEQIRAEGNRRLEGIKSNFQQSVIAANEAGFNNAQAARDYLNKGQARIVGDTLVGSAAGIPSSIWEKRDKAAAAGSVGAKNFPGPPSEKLIEMAPGVKMGEETAARYAANMRDRAKRAADSQPNYAKAKVALERIARERDEKAKTDFDAGVKKWNETLQSREDDKNIREMATMEQRAARRAYADAIAARRNASNARNPVTASEEANRAMYAAEARLGPSNNRKVRDKRFYENAKKRFEGNRATPPPAPASSPLSFFMDRSNPFTSTESINETSEQSRKRKAQNMLASQLGFNSRFLS
jgi:hypothetical protein